MRTIVYQSFRTENVPAWISECLKSVQRWAAGQGFEYRFFDDSFFELIPPELRTRASEHKCVMADFARLVAARNLLEEGFDRAVWLDADALVFAPTRFQIPTQRGYAFCREIWLDRVVLGHPQFNLTVNNSVSVFCRDEAIIEFYLDAASSILAGSAPLTPLSIGTEFLLKLQRARKFPLLTNVGIFGPEMLYRYEQNDGKFLRPYINFQTSPVYAANLCLSHQTKTFRFQGSGSRGWTLDEGTLLKNIERLQADEGQSLNAWFDGSYLPKSAEFDRPLSRVIRVKKALKGLIDSR